MPKKSVYFEKKTDKMAKPKSVKIKKIGYFGTKSLNIIQKDVT